MISNLLWKALSAGGIKLQCVIHLKVYYIIHKYNHVLSVPPEVIHRLKLQRAIPTQEEKKSTKKKI